MLFEMLEESPHFRGNMWRGLFDNGYGVSVIPEGDGHTYELAVLQHCERRRAHLTYETEITSDVIRHCTVEAVEDLITRVQNLPATL